MSAKISENRILSMITVTLMITVLAVLAMTFSSFAQGPGTGIVPYDIEFDSGDYEHLCYAGHPSDKVVYADGYALPADTEFTVLRSSEKGPDPDISKLSCEISLLYENEDHTMCVRELIKRFDEGDFKEGEYYRILSDTSIVNLKDRQKLYSSPLASYEITLAYDKQQKKKIHKRIYAFICDDNTFSRIIERKDQ